MSAQHHANTRIGVAGFSRPTRATDSRLSLVGSAMDLVQTGFGGQANQLSLPVQSMASERPPVPFGSAWRSGSWRTSSVRYLRYSRPQLIWH